MVNAMKEWTILELNLLQYHCRRLSIKELAELIGRSENAVSQKLNSLGLKSRPATLFYLANLQMKNKIRNGQKRVMKRGEPMFKDFEFHELKRKATNEFHNQLINLTN